MAWSKEQCRLPLLPLQFIGFKSTAAALGLVSQTGSRQRRTALAVKVPVLSKHTTLTYAAVLSFSALNTLTPFALSLAEQAPLTPMMIVGIATGTAAMKVLSTFTTMLP